MKGNWNLYKYYLLFYRKQELIFAIRGKTRLKIAK